MPNGDATAPAPGRPPAALSPAEVGREVIDLRARGIAWKEIEGCYAISRVTLWRYALAAARPDDNFETK